MTSKINLYVTRFVPEESKKYVASMITSSRMLFCPLPNVNLSTFTEF